MGERVYLSKTRIHRNNTGELVYLSDTLLWGENIRVHSGGRSETISPRDLSRKESFGLPFPSPDEDRIAYLRASRPRFGEKATTSLMITKLNAGSWSRSISDLAELPGDIETTTWEPIGWTPDGYDFMLRKSEGGKTEIWAVDWVAQGPHRFLEEYSDTIITSDDLPGNGEWLSLLKPAPGGKWNLELVNYRSGESVSLGIFEDRPVRTWADYGGQFIFWEPTGGLAIYATGEQIELVSTHPDFPSALEMKWTEKLTLVVADTAPPAATPRLIMLDPKTFSITPLVDNWRPGIDQWDWLDSQTLIYSDRDGLWLWRFYLDDGPKTLYSFASSGNSK